VSQTVSLTPPYAIVEELRQYMAFPPDDPAADVDLQRALDAGKAWIDWFCGRSFGVSPDLTERVYAAATEDTVPLLDLQSAVPVVALDTAGDRTFATALDAEQFELYPLTGAPYDTLRAWPTPGGGLEPVVFVPGQLVRVTGVWGFTDERGRCPAPVNQANLLLGARWTKRREAPFSVLQSLQLDVFQNVPPVDQDVYQLLFPFCVPGSPGAALLAATAPAAGTPVGAASWVMV
jgi:hypothetical protein